MEGLEDEADAAGTKLGTAVLGKIEEILPVELDLSGGGLVQPGQEAQEGGLAAPRGSDHGDERFGGHLQVDGA